MDKNWYVIHTYSGYENKVKANLEKKISSMGLGDRIFNILVPLEDVEEYKDREKRIVKRKVFPGYVLIEMEMTDDSWYVVRNTPGVTGFVGSGNKPIPLNPWEVKNILKQMGIEEPKPKVMYKRGDEVKVTSGPFENFHGVIEEINMDRKKLKVAVSMFGRNVLVELEFTQVVPL